MSRQPPPLNKSVYLIIIFCLLWFLLVFVLVLESGNPSACICVIGCVKSHCASLERVALHAAVRALCPRASARLYHIKQCVWIERAGDRLTAKLMARHSHLAPRIYIKHPPPGPMETTDAAVTEARDVF